MECVLAFMEDLYYIIIFNFTPLQNNVAVKVATLYFVCYNTVSENVDTGHSIKTLCPGPKKVICICW